MKLFKSFGLKRIIANALLALAQAAHSIPEGAAIAAILEQAAAAFGAVGVAHGAKTVFSRKYLLSSIAALLAIAPYIPGLAPYAEAIRQLGAILAAYNVGNFVANKASK